MIAVAGIGGVLAGLAVLAIGGSGSSSAQVISADRPNVIVVMTDDQGPGMMKALPSVTQQIGGAGVTFEQAIATYPLCCPSRASFLTGQYAHNHGTLGNGPRSGGGYQALAEPRRNLASWLQASGYETAFVGKWLNGLRTPRVAPPGWTRWHGLVGAGGESLSSFYDYNVFEPDGTPRHFGNDAADYQTDALTREYAVPLINEQAQTPGPFFLWVGYHPPHDGLGRNDAAGRRCSLGAPGARGGRQSAIPAPRYARRFRSAAIPRPPSFDERDVSDKPGFLRRADELGRKEREVIGLNYRCGLAAMLAVDEAIQAIVEMLRATGQLDDTVLVFTTDQGSFTGEHRIKAGKNQP
ncbi:MAG TPA: sulfatase-like hydrolase/transferase, partial [Solirubrobacterales bacterium]|nr:sulfatase-like hydrolase/transferase [Solirubrobacterales bacterium]